MAKSSSKPVRESVAKEVVEAYVAKRKGLVPPLGTRLGTQEKLELLQKGVSKKDLEQFKELSGLDYDALARLLNVTRATLINKKGAAKFSITIAERIIALVDLYAIGFDIFESVPPFNAWMSRTNRALGGKSPLELSENQFGREEVKNILGRIEFGVHS
jgi:putative toxin-antitoxin system antitoxin component (TIGR02293 family)